MTDLQESEWVHLSINTETGVMTVTGAGYDPTRYEFGSKVTAEIIPAPASTEEGEGKVLRRWKAKDLED